MLFIAWKMQKIQGLMKSIDDSAWTCAQKCNYMERRAWVKKAVLLIIKGPDNPTSQLLPIMSFKSSSGDGKEGKTKEVVKDCV